MCSNGVDARRHGRKGVGEKPWLTSVKSLATKTRTVSTIVSKLWSEMITCIFWKGR
jgi:hypothetical protein